MIRVTFCTIFVLLALFPINSMAQLEPQPEVSVDCTNPYDNSLNPDPNHNYYNSVRVDCEISNNNPYRVEVEFEFEWQYLVNEGFPNEEIAPSSTLLITFDISADEKAAAGLADMTLLATVVKYADLRECTNCVTNSDTLEIEIMGWSSFDIDLITETPEDSFNINDLYDFRECQFDIDYQLVAEIHITGNEINNLKVGYDSAAYSSDYAYYSSLIDINQPSDLPLEASSGDTVEFEATFSIELTSDEPFEEDVYVFFIIVVGESEEVDESIENERFYGNVEVMLGGCLIVSIEGEASDDDIEPIIIQTQSTDSNIYLLAGAGGAMTITLLIILISILLRKRKE